MKGIIFKGVSGGKGHYSKHKKSRGGDVSYSLIRTVELLNIEA